MLHSSHHRSSMFDFMLLIVLFVLVSLGFGSCAAHAAKPKIGGDWADGFDGLISVIEQAKEAAANGDPSLLADVRAALLRNIDASKAVNKPVAKRKSRRPSEIDYVCQKCGWKPSDDGPMNRKGTFEPLVAATRSASHAYDCRDGASFAVVDDVAKNTEPTLANRVLQLENRVTQLEDQLIGSVSVSSAGRFQYASDPRKLPAVADAYFKLPLAAIETPPVQTVSHGNACYGPGCEGGSCAKGVLQRAPVRQRLRRLRIFDR